MNEKAGRSVLNLPNALSLSRIGAVPVLVLLLSLSDGFTMCVVCTVLFTVASLTDLVDGYLARRYQLVTNLGRFLDPLADKLLVLAALVMLVALDRAPAWMAFLILAREISVTGLRGIAAAEGIIISASALGKRKTLSQNIAIGMLIWHYPVWGISIHLVGAVLLWVALILTYWSGAAYFAGFYRVLTGQQTSRGRKEK